MRDPEGLRRRVHERDGMIENGLRNIPGSPIVHCSLHKEGRLWCMLSYRIASYEQGAQGALAREGYKAVLLPYTQAAKRLQRCPRPPC